MPTLLRRPPGCGGTLGRMDLDVVFLGTGGSVPTARRATACLLVRAGGDRILVDCGEGAQRQMQRSTGLVQVDDLYITHFHADHYLGVPGLLKTYELNGREAPLRIFGPPGLEELFVALRRIMGNVLVPARADRAERLDARPLRHLRDPPVRGRAPRARLRLRARRGRAARSLRPRRGRAPRRQARPRLRAPSGRRERERRRAGAGDGRDAPRAARS